MVEIGHSGEGFGFDNEFPRHSTYLAPFALADRPVTCGEWLCFMEDGGYHRPEFWLSDGWSVVMNQGLASHRSTGTATPTSPMPGTSSP